MMSFESAGTPPERHVYTVSRLNLEAQGLLEGSFPLIWLEGELSNLSRPGSGHLYFSLKDDRAQVSAAMFRNRNQLLRFTPRNGLQVLVRARVTLYVPRGSYQLVVEHMEEAGEGRLRAQFEALKARLQAEGLFDVARKRPLPPWPRQIGVITSATGAALHDILQVLRRRCPQIPVLVYPAAVQGQQAPQSLRQALALAVARDECDVLILGRGGGSLEDLWAFNDEALARDVAASPIPVVSAVGHEVDVALTDFAADLRAPTPSAAAELVGPDLTRLEQQVQLARRRLGLQLKRLLMQRRQQLQGLQARLRQPRDRLEPLAQQLDELEGRLRRTLQQRLRLALQQQHQLQRRLAAQSPQQRLARDRQYLHQLQRRLLAQSPALRLVPLQAQLHQWSQRLPAAFQRQHQARQRTLAALSHRLHAASPLSTLARGYSLSFVQDQPLRSIRQVAVGDPVITRLADGRLITRVEQVLQETDGPAGR